MEPFKRLLCTGLAVFCLGSGLASAAAPEPAVKPTGAAASAGKTLKLTEVKNTVTKAIRDPLAGADPKILEKFCLVKGGTYKK